MSGREGISRTPVPLFREKWHVFDFRGHWFRYLGEKGLIIPIFYQIAERMSAKFSKALKIVK